uniref:Protein phosphatase, Mg2+/Mn2+ dependent, 1H n=1 Tax=Neogobius melanostomus TaxID=47308 RepID=A0A8C6UE55_9GOBI
MLTRVKSAVATNGEHPGGGGSELPLRFPYTRPQFLGLSPDEVECSADHIARPILILKETKRLTWSTGYAEVINAGKSALNEDQACCELRRSSLPNGDGLAQQENTDSSPEDLPFHYWALFDGHAGSGVAVMASHLLHHHIALHLQEVMDILVSPSLATPICLGEEPLNNHHLAPAQKGLSRAVSLRGAAGAPGSPNAPPTRFFSEKKVSHESLVVGAIENAFKDMDFQIEREKSVYNISGGCTALVVVYLLGNLYVGNAGDSRAIIIRSGEVVPMSSEFTPESERQRLQFLAYMQPHLLGNEFTHLEFPRRVQRKELLKIKVIIIFLLRVFQARVLATIGVTRGLGDHNLKVHDSNIFIKPFLSCCPEVKVYPLSQFEHGADDVLVLGTDGLWDVLSNQEVAEAVSCFLANCDPDDQHRYTMAAQDLVMKARGFLKDRGWRISNDRLGSGMISPSI